MARTQTEVSFKVSPADRDLINQIAERAVMEFAEFGFTSKLDVVMDLCAVHANGNPIDFEKLLAAKNGDFGHDIGGIRRHLDRDTGELTDCFDPRCSFSYRLVQLASDVLVTATEGGSNYWARVVSRDMSQRMADTEILYPRSVELHDEGQSKDLFVTQSDVIRAARRIAKGEVQPLNKDIIAAVALALATPAEADIDAEAADVIMQVACLGEVVYG